MRTSTSGGNTLFTFLIGARLASLAAGLTHPPQAAAQCTFGWRPGEGVPGVQGGVLCLTDWDPDGAGPAPSVVVAGGVISAAGNALVTNVAMWDGAAWHALGNGLAGIFNGQPQTVWVNALAVYNNELIAGGTFRIQNGPFPTLQYIAKWNGTAWVSMGSGGLPSPVNALIVHNGELLAGISTGVVRWTGASWESFAGTNDQVNALYSFNGDLIAGGRFSTITGVPTANRIARWNGATWSALGTGLTGGFNAPEVHEITSLNNELYVGGHFLNAGSGPANHVAKWDGANWSALGNGVPWDVRAMEALGSQIIVGGLFNEVAGVVGTRLLASWNGTQWDDVGEGHWYESNNVSVLKTINGELWEGGEFKGVGTVGAASIARWDGGTWHVVGSPNHVNMLNDCVKVGDGLVCVGKILPTLQYPADDVAIWRNGQWHSFAGGVHVDGNNEMVLAVTTFNAPTGPEIVIAGSFTSVNGVNAKNIARWNGTNWLPLSGGLSSVTNPQVFDLMEFNGRLYAAGSFETANGLPIKYLAQWTGTFWTSIGGPLDFWVRTLTVDNGFLVAGGNFQYAAGSPVNRIARWSGSNWQAYGPGVDGSVHSMTHYQGELIAGGSLNNPMGVARWTGSNWLPLGSGVDSNVYGLALYDNQLIAGGIFALAGGTSAQKIARWNGAGWQTMGAGLGSDNALVSTIRVHAGELLVGGSFANSGPIISARFARWGPLCPRGDMNCDQAIDQADIPQFINALLNAGSLTTCEAYLADLNADDTPDGNDIAPLVACVTGSCP